MARMKIGFDKAARTTILLDEEQLHHLKKIIAELSKEKGRSVSQSEAIRWAIEQCFPRQKQLELFEGKAV